MVRYVRSLALVVAVCLAASSLPAVVSAQAPDSSKSSVRFRFAGGVDLGIGDSFLSGRSALGLVGLEWLHGRAPFSARLDLSYFRDAQDYDQAGLGGCERICRYADRYEMLGLSLDGRYTFFSARAVRPYLLSGFGLYRSARTGTANFTCELTTCVSTPGARSTFTTSSFGLGLHGGLGLAVPIRRSEISLELRFQQLTSGFRYGHTVPILLGVRF
jgi:hypothetical protein